jgi:hypothetical protein
MPTQDQVLVVRDGEGNFYLLSGKSIEAARVSDEQKAKLEQALTSDTSGFFFDFLNQVNAINNPQTVNNTATQVAAGVFTGPQNLTQVGINTSNINAANFGRA